MKKTLLFMILLVSFGLTQQSCSSKNDPEIKPEEQTSNDPNDIYVAGFEKNENNVSVAKVWKNGIATELSNGQKESIAKSVYVSGNDVYVAGIATNASGVKVATLWKNGMSTALSDGTSNADATSVFVTGNDIYVAGFDLIDGKATPVFWKNGVKTVLPLEVGGFGGGADAITVQGGNVYVAGHEIPQKAKYWTNGTATVIPADGGNTFLVNGIAASGNDVYVVGTVNINAVFKAKLWKNGASQDLHLGNFLSTANGIFVSGSDVYVAGNEAAANNLVYGKIWKNGVASELVSESNSVTGKGVFVVGNDVYAVGDKLVTGAAKVIMTWKNGKELKQVSNSNNMAEAYSIFVVKK